ncbi:DNA polymerase III subunit beta family protein [Streptomyces bacillaris]
MSTDQNTPEATTTPEATAHFTAPYAPLVEALTVAAYGTAAATTHTPATACVLIEADESGLTLRTHDWETAVSSTVPEATVTQHGASLLPLDQLRKALTAMVAGETKTTAARTTVTLDGDLLATEHLTVPLEALPVGEFIPAPTPAPVAAHMDAPDLYRQLQRVLPAAGTDDTLPVLMGVEMTLTGQALTLAATDRYRFAVADIPTTPHPDHPRTAPDHPLTALVPARALTRLSKHLKTQTGRVGIAFGTPELTLTTGTTTITLQQTHGTLPGHNALFPKTVDTSLTLDRATAERALKKCRAMITAKGHGRDTCVTLRWDDTGALTLAPRVGEPEGQARVKGMPLPSTPLAGPTPKDREVHLRNTFLRDALETFAGADTLTLHLQEETATRQGLPPVLLTDGPHPTGEGYRHLLMPVRVS